MFFVLLFFTGCSSAQSANMVLPVAFKMQIDTIQEHILLDVRTAAEFSSGHIENAINMDWNSADFEQKMKQLNPNKTVLIYCFSGARSMQAAELMRLKGFKTVYELEGGIQAWKKSEFPLIP